jgi:hypothetical protein
VVEQLQAAQFQQESQWIAFEQTVIQTQLIHDQNEQTQQVSHQSKQR